MAQQPSGQQGIPDFYADSFQITITPFGVNMTFSLREAHPSARLAPSTDLVRVRTSLEHTKMIAMMMRRQLKNYERENQLTIQVPAQVYTQLGLAEEDWGLP